MDRELLLEIGCEELPAGWLLRLTTEIGEVVADGLREQRLVPETPIETFSTPRRLTAWVAGVPDRQTDLEELVNGPPVSASFHPDGTATQAAIGFAAKYGVEVSALERTSTPKGEYLAFRKQQRGRAAIDVLPAVLGRTLRKLTFPKLMHWDAVLDDGHGELLFGRPIRWLLFLYGGRVVPFTIGRTVLAQTSQVQDVSTGAVTYGHRFLTTSGRAGRAIKVRSFDEYRTKLLENFVILGRSDRHDKIVRELEGKARRLKGRVSRVVHAGSALLEEVPDLVEYPFVIAGTFASEFTEKLPAEVLMTTLIHHQHYFPVEDEGGKLRPAFLAVINTEPENERTIASNAERVVTARLRDAMFFWENDRRATLESRIDRLATLLFHKKLGTYKDKAGRIERLAAWIAEHVFGAEQDAVRHAATAARLAKADLTTDMVREFTELQGTIGGIYVRAEGLPEPVWKAIYFHYLPVGLEETAPPTRSQLGKAAVSWASVSLADKLDTIVGLFAAGERPTGSRDPFGLRRAVQGVVKILTDLSSSDLGEMSSSLPLMIDQTYTNYGQAVPAEADSWRTALSDFFIDREMHLFERRGFRADEARAVVPAWWPRPNSALRRVQALSKARESPDFETLAVLFKRVKNITKDFDDGLPDNVRGKLVEPAEIALFDELEARWPAIESARSQERFGDAMRELAALGKPVDRFFVDVLVMTEDRELRKIRLALLAALRRTILNIADIAEIAPEPA